MWRLPGGGGDLKPTLKRLFVSGLIWYVWELTHFEDLDDADNYFFSVPLLNQIAKPDRKYVFLLVLEEMLYAKTEPTLTAWREGVVYEVFQELECRIDYELEQAQDSPADPAAYVFRQMVREASANHSGLPPVTADDPGPWRNEIQNLSERILWDTDYLLYETFADAPPVQWQVVKGRRGMDGGHYTSTPPLFTIPMRARLNRLSKKAERWMDQWNEAVKKRIKL